MQNVTGAASAAEAAAEKPSLKARALDELRQYAIITLYLWVFFALFSFYRRMILEENGISVWQQTLAIVNALVFGKVILIAQALHLEAGLRKYPRIYIVLGNALMFTIVLMAFHILEEAIKAWFDGPAARDQRRRLRRRHPRRIPDVGRDLFCRSDSLFWHPGGRARGRRTSALGSVLHRADADVQAGRGLRLLAGSGLTDCFSAFAMTG